MNKSMVLQLQEQLYNNEISTLEALRKALVISRKLKIDDTINWINQELNGYPTEDIPDYRIINGEFEGYVSLFHYWRPIITKGEIWTEINFYYSRESISEIEKIISECKEGFVTISRNELSEYVRPQSEVRLKIPIQQIVGIQESVKNELLEWTLKLEELGIIGENMSFSENEKEKVKELGSTINYVYGNQQIMQNSNNSTQTINITNIKSELSSLIEKLEDGINNQEFYSKVSENVMQEIKEEIQILKKEVIKEVPDKTLIVKSINFMKEIFMRTTTSLIAGGLLNLISQIHIQ